MNVQRGELKEFDVLLPKALENYDAIDAQVVFYNQLSIENGPNNGSVNNPVSFQTRIVERWKSTKNSSGAWSPPTFGFSPLRFDPERGVVLFLQYDALKYPKNQKGSLEVRLKTVEGTFDVLTHVVTVFENESAEKLCVVQIEFQLDPGVNEESTTGGFFVPRVNTWRSDGQHVYFVRAGWNTFKEIPIEPTTENSANDISYYGVDIFCKKTQVPVVRSFPEVELVQRTPDPATALTQNLYTLFFKTSSVVSVRIKSLGRLPSEVAGLTGTPSDSQVSLSWQPPTDTGDSPILAYQVERSTDNTNWQDLGTTTGTGFVATSLTNGQSYYFRVAAVNAIGAGGFASTGPHVPLGLPSQVRQLSATAGDRQVSLTWAAPSQSGGSSILNYVVEMSLDGSTWQSVSSTQNTALTAPSLVNGTQYYFRVAAVNSLGVGPFSQTGPHMPFVIDVVFDPSTEQGFLNSTAEWAEVHNRSVVPVDFTGWRMTSHVAGPGPSNPCVLGATPQIFNFPSGFVLAANTKVRVYSGFGAANIGAYNNPNGNPPSLEWNATPMWLNGGDVARLYRPNQTIGVDLPFAEFKTGSCVGDPIPND